MAAPADPNSPPSKPSPPPTPILGKPVIKTFPTPDARDYIVMVRKDIRTGGFTLPTKGDPFEGVDNKEIAEGFQFATAVPSDPPGVYVDLYYLRPRVDQEKYNAEVDFPYVDHNYPRYNRSYVVLRTDNLAKDEPDADTVDPVFKELLLTDHQIKRFTDPVLDALFVQVVRTFERLPGPIIKSIAENQFQQRVVIQAQDVLPDSDAPKLSALAESAKQECTGTAKAKNTLATVPRVFPADVKTADIPSMTRELWLAGFFESATQQTQAGIVFQPSISSGKYSETQRQITEFKKETETRNIPFPQERHHKEITEEFGGGVLTEDMYVDSSDSPLDVDQGYLVVESRLRNLDAFGKVKLTKRLAGTEWPVLHEERVETDGIYAGIKTLIDKQVVPAGTPNPGGYTDMIPHDVWRTLQITSRIDLSTLPKPVTYLGTHPLSLPATLLSVKGVYGDEGGSSRSVFDDGKNGEGVSVSVHSAPLGTIAVTTKNGYHGNALAWITRIFLPGPPDQLSNGGVVINGSTYKPLKLLGVNGTAVMFSTSSKFTGSLGALISASSNEGQQRVHTAEFGPVLTGQFLASGPDNVSFQGAGNAAAASTTDGKYSLTFFQPGNKCKLTVEVPMSEPAFLPNSGTAFLADIDIRQWRMGIWVVHLINAIVP